MALLLAEVNSQAMLIEKLRHQLAGHRNHRFGSSSERIEQLRLALETSDLDHGILELHNNTAERAMRPVAIGCKNCLFVGSEAGGRAAAIAYTLIETAKLNGVDPQAWLADTLACLPEYKITRLDDLLPWNHGR